MFSKEDIKIYINDIEPYKIGDMKTEKFKQVIIDNIELPYLISSYGRIFRCNDNYSVRELKPRIKSNGYLEVTLSYNGKKYYVLIHRLVGFAFIKNDDNINKTQINHINAYKTDNHYWNLEWCTPKENIKHMNEHNLKYIRKGSRVNFNIYSEDDIITVCKLLTENVSYKDISEKTGISYDMIRTIYKKKAWKHITKNYDFSNYNYGRTEEEDENKIKQINLVCKMLEEGNHTKKYISKYTGISYGIVNKIHNHEIYKYISNNYNF